MGHSVTKLKPFQLEGVEQIWRFRGRALLADEMGLGKTIQALYWISKLPKRRPVVIVTPSSVKWNWHAEAALHFGMRLEVLEGRWQRGRELPDGELYVLNYDLLPSWVKILRKRNPQVVVFDEAHYITNMKAKRTRASIKLSKKASSVLALSGTPFTNRPIELWPVLRCVRPDLFPSREEYAWTYCKPRYTPWGWKYDGASNTKELNRILRNSVMIRRLKKDVLTELPEKQRKITVFKSSLKDQREYAKAQEDFLTWLRQKSPARAQRAKKSPALTKVGYLLRLCAQLKLVWTTKWIEEFFESNPGEKLVAFTMNTFVIEHLKKHFSKALVIDGSVNGRKRQETVRLFQNNPRHNLMLGQWKAAGVGLTMTAAKNVAALDFPWTPGDLAQGEDRVHRIGQKFNVTVHYLVLLGTIEEKLIRILQKKAQILDSVLNGDKEEEDLGIFDELLKIMKGGS